MTLIVPELTGNKDLLPRNTSSLYGFANNRLSVIAMKFSPIVCLKSQGKGLPSCCIKMAITCVKSGKDCCFLGVLILPGSETNGRDLSAIGKSEGFLIVIIVIMAMGSSNGSSLESKPSRELDICLGSSDIELAFPKVDVFMTSSTAPPPRDVISGYRGFLGYTCSCTALALQVLAEDQLDVGLAGQNARKAPHRAARTRHIQVVCVLLANEDLNPNLGND